MGNLAVVAHAAGDLRAEGIAEPQPAPDEAIVEVAHGGICGSDLHYWRHGAAGFALKRLHHADHAAKQQRIVFGQGRWRRFGPRRLGNRPGRLAPTPGLIGLVQALEVGQARLTGLHSPATFAHRARPCSPWRRW